MLKRLVITIIAILPLALGSPLVGAASANGDDGSGDERTRRHDMIWEGLCVGASLDLSFESQVSCAKQARAADEPSAQPPNIGAGLCVGASLDLSPASQARCVQATQQQSSPQNIPEDNGNKVGHEDKHEKHKKPEAHPTPSHPAAEYAALGDSIAAGLGLSSPADTQEACGRTFDAYPYTVANDRGLEINHLACSGATIGDLFTEQGINGPNIPPQLDRAFASGAPELITITAGANDVRWENFLAKCYASTCGTNVDDQVASGLMAALDLKLQLLFQNIEQRSNGSPPEVVVTGYYLPFSDHCSQMEPRLTLQETSWLNAQTEILNQKLQNAADQHDFATFVPIDFTGHDICSGDPWIQTLDDPAPFHPTFEGQQAIARAIN